MHYTLRLSPCPNDTFAFYALLHSEIDLEGTTFDVTFSDIETLNEMIAQGDGDIVKASIAMTSCAEEMGYRLLKCGGALGRGNGPVVVRSSNSLCSGKIVALPGERTTAALLFNRYFEGYSPIYRRFNEVATAVERGEASLGVLIHEGRFTYMDRGLELVCDLGDSWERETSLPIPLGGIYYKDKGEFEKIERIISRSVEWAMAHPSAPLDFVRSHASELSPEVMQNHIDYFVNRYTVHLDDEGLRAINTLISD